MEMRTGPEVEEGETNGLGAGFAAERSREPLYLATGVETGTGIGSGTGTGARAAPTAKGE